MSTCQACGSKAIVFLCNSCTGQLREILEELPLWIGYLEDAAVGHVKLGDGGGGRSTARREPFKGDDEVLARCACGHPETKHDDYYVARDGNARSVEQGCTAIDRDEETMIETPCNCREYRPRTDQEKLRTQLLSAGRFNGRAGALLDKVHNSLSTWVRHIGETRGITFVRPKFVGPLLPGHIRMAATNRLMLPFLTEHVQAIACDETAGECLSEFQNYVSAIEDAVNRPMRRVWLGDCPTWNEHTRRICGVSLWAPEDAVEVRCHQCRGTHDPRRLKLLLFNDLERKKVPWTKILQANKSQPEDRQVSERTLQSWRRSGKFPIRGYLRPNGREVINRHSDDDQPLYLWPDVRKLRDAKPQKKVTGAAARVRA